MGCVASKLDINDVHPNIFAVNNVDDVGLQILHFSLYHNIVYFAVANFIVMILPDGHKTFLWPTGDN